MFAKRVYSLVLPLTRLLALKSLPLIASRSRNINSVSGFQVACYTTLPTEHVSATSDLTPIEFERQSEHTLEYLNTFVEELSDTFDLGSEFDVSYSSGVLSIVFGPPHGTYVLNKQTPNKQIWLSSPKSGPKRFDYDSTTHSWIYRHDKSDLFDLLSKEISDILNAPVVFRNPILDS